MMSRKGPTGFSLIELMIVVAVIGVISAIAIPGLMQSKRAANEASALKTVRNLVSAEMTYMTTTGSGSYGSITTLENNELVDEVVGGGTKDGYTFTVNLGASADSFTIDARPNDYESTGVRSFFSDQTGVIRYTTADAAATSTSDPL